MATRKIRLPSPNTVAASSTSLISCPVGPAYRYGVIHLQLGVVQSGGGASTRLPTGSGTTAGYVNDIRVKVNGKVQRLHTAAECAKLNAMNGTLFVTNTYGTSAASKEYGQVLSIWFREPWRKSLKQQEALCLPTGSQVGVRTLEVEVDFGALSANEASFVCKAFAEVDGNQPDEIHANGVVMSKVFRQNITGGTAAGSAVDITTLDRRDLYTTVVAELGGTAQPGTVANGLNVATIGSYTGQLKISANGVDVFDLPKDVAYLAHQASGLNPQQFDLEAVLDSTDDIRSGLTADGLSDLRVRIDLVADTADGAGWKLITERTGLID